MSQVAPGERELMPPVNENFARIDFGGYLDGLVHKSRERPTLHIARPGGKKELCRKDPFAIPTIPNGHSHALARRNAQDQIPFAAGVDQPPMTPNEIFELALGEMAPGPFKDLLRKAEADDIADVIPDEVIAAAARQYNDIHAALPR